MTSPTPTVSVALCSYNGEPYITQQLESIVQQTAPPDEIVVCDDGSTDGTLDRIADMARRHSAIRLVRNTANLGFTRNFEQAITLASKDLIFLSDQDDVWLPGRVQVMRDLFAAQPEVGMVHANLQFTDEHLNPITPTQQYQRQFPTQPRAPHLVFRKWGGIHGCTMAFRAALKPFLLPIPEVWTHDAWIAMIAHIFSDVRRTEDVLMYYRIHLGSTGGNVKFTAPSSQVLKTKVKRSHIKYYTDERVRWAGLYERLREIDARPELTPAQRDGVALYLAETRRRAAFAQQRETLKQQPRLRRVFPALRILAAGDYTRYLNGLVTFAKDVLLT